MEDETQALQLRACGDLAWPLFPFLALVLRDWFFFLW